MAFFLCSHRVYIFFTGASPFPDARCSGFGRTIPNMTTTRSSPSAAPSSRRPAAGCASRTTFVPRSQPYLALVTARSQRTLEPQQVRCRSPAAHAERIWQGDFRDPPGRDRGIRCSRRAMPSGTTATTVFSLSISRHRRRRGALFKTLTGGWTVRVRTLHFTKSLRPAPDKFHGLGDAGSGIGTRLGPRPERRSRARFRRRSRAPVACGASWSSTASWVSASSIRSPSAPTPALRHPHHALDQRCPCGSRRSSISSVSSGASSACSDNRSFRTGHLVRHTPSQMMDFLRGVTEPPLPHGLNELARQVRSKLRLDEARVGGLESTRAASVDYCARLWCVTPAFGCGFERPVTAVSHVGACAHARAAMPASAEPILRTGRSPDAFSLFEAAVRAALLDLHRDIRPISRRSPAPDATGLTERSSAHHCREMATGFPSSTTPKACCAIPGAGRGQ